MSRFFACMHKDDNLRKLSSSGGFFTALAEHVLSLGGVVYGASFTDDYRSVEHICIKESGQICRLRGPKYIASKIGGIYKEIKEQLNENSIVLFSGTPCQVYGLKRFLGVEFQNLITVDLVCHGVADKRIYNHYLDLLEQRYQSKICSLSFRDKRNSWRRPDFLVKFENGCELRESVSDNAFMKGFIQNLFLRESCSHCQFKNFTSGSDFTIGDFWGSTEIATLAKDDVGISVVAVHSDKAIDIFNRISPEMKGIVELNEKEAFLFNESYMRSSSLHPKRNDFYTNYLSYDFDSYVNRLLFKPKKKESFFKLFLTKLKNTIRRYAHA